MATNGAFESLTGNRVPAAPPPFKINEIVNAMAFSRIKRSIETKIKKKKNQLSWALIFFGGKVDFQKRAAHGSHSRESKRVV